MSNDKFGIIGSAATVADDVRDCCTSDDRIFFDRKEAFAIVERAMDAERERVLGILMLVGTRIRRQGSAPSHPQSAHEQAVDMVVNQTIEEVRQAAKANREEGAAA